MARPKKGTKAGDIASQKWHDTMTQKYGSYTDFMRKAGRLGGLKSTGGGFATKTNCNCNLIDGPHTAPQCAGKKGGTISKRGKSYENIN